MPAEIQAYAFFLADHAVVENGKLYVNGGFWNQVYSAEYPVVRAFALAAVLHIPWHKHHHGHEFAVTFEDADSRPLATRFGARMRKPAWTCVRAFWAKRCRNIPMMLDYGRIWII